MSKLLALLLLASTVGCSSLARGGAAGAARSGDDEVEEEDALPVAGAESTSPPPGQTEVAWEDNGVPIRRLKGPGKPHEMKVPESNVQKKPSTVTK
jgi:hypothetical protein